MATLADVLVKKIETREARAGVVGLGYVGLPLAVELARCGLKTTGIDVDERKVQAINEGRSYIPDVPSTEIQALREAGLLCATTDFAAVRELDTVNICVPTPLRKTKDPDMSFVVAAAEQVAAHLHPGILIILESTTYPGTTEEVLQTRFESPSFKPGVDFFLAFSPERVDPGNPTFNTRNVPKVVGGTTPECMRVAAALYGTALDRVVPVSSTRVAEMVKLLENTFRAVNIGLVNELALMCDRLGIDVWEVIEAAGTKPFGFMPFYPGPGLGGHCIPIDPFYLSWKAREHGFESRFIELAGHINSTMPHYVVEKIAEALNSRRKSLNGSSVLILGVSYKRDVDDIRESPALDVMAVARARGARIAYSDPFVPRIFARQWAAGEDLTSQPLTPDALKSFDCVAILTDHSSFDYAGIIAAAHTIVDTRNAIKTRHPHVLKLGSPHKAHQAGDARDPRLVAV